MPEARKVRSLSEHVAATDTLPQDLLLGHLAVTTVHNLAYPRDDLVTLFESLGLDPEHIPPLSTPAGAFAKATNRQEFEYEMPNGSLGVLRTEDVTSPNPREVVLKAIVRKEQGRTRPLLDFQRVGEVRLYRPVRKGRGGRVLVESARFLALLDRENTLRHEQKHVAAFLQHLEARYVRYCTTLDGHGMRALLTSYLRGPLQAVPLKPSVNFVPIRHADVVKKLAQAAAAIEGVQLDLIPMVDLGNQREIVVRAVQESTEAELTQLAARLREASASPSTLVRLREQYDELMARTATYREMLGEAVARTSSASDIVQALLRDLAHRVFETKEQSS